MGLQQTFKNAAKTVFAAAGDVKRTITYTKVLPGVYNPSTGTTSPTETSESFLGIVAGYSAHDADGSKILTTDSRLLFEYGLLTIRSTPSKDDYLTVDGDRYEIIDFKTDPALAHWNIQVRRS